MAIAVYLDVSARSERVMAHVLEPPGLGIRFESRQALQAGLGAAIAEHLAWLRAHGERVPEVGAAEPGGWFIAGEFPLEGDFESGDDVGFYPPDLEALTPGQVERYLRIAGWARAELVELARGLSPEALEWRMDERTRPIRLILRHVANAELWYMTRVIDDPQVHGMPPELDALDQRMDATEDPIERLLMVREGFERFFRGLPEERLNRVVVPRWFCSVTTERWTARKALRRCIEHEQEHTRNVRRILEAWERRR